MDQDELRSVAPLPFGGATIVPKADVGRPPRVEFVDPRSLYVEARYQRDVVGRGKRQVRRIVEGWDWTHFKCPVVSRRRESGNVLVVIDGQHTAIAAATHGGIPKIPVLVVDAEQIGDRAEAFVAHNRNRVALTTTQIHFARVLAGNRDAAEIQRACDAAGVTIVAALPHHPPFRAGTTTAVTVMDRVLKAYGYDALLATLKVLAPAAPIFAPFVLAAAEHLNSGGGPASLAAAIRSKSAPAWMAELKAVEHAYASQVVALQALWARQSPENGPAKAGNSPAKPGRSPEAAKPGEASSAEIKRIPQKAVPAQADSPKPPRPRYQTPSEAAAAALAMLEEEDD